MRTPSAPLTETVTHLKEQIASRTYHVDSRAVAREMLFKLRMMRLAKNQQRQRHMSVSGPGGPSPE
ncbi:MAG: flagellar biosynthesis anti-sigma factor FlgM [Actinobacteria bacterium]|nr:MAG: flagellar biosynthesis anti-sigma factor FlgM [Actinomycetota bacterium]